VRGEAKNVRGEAKNRRHIGAMALTMLLAGCVAPPTLAPKPEPAEAVSLQPTSFAAIPGWGSDDPVPAWEAFRRGCAVLRRQAAWQEICAEIKARTPPAQEMRGFFENRFTPYRVVNPDGSDEGLITGYYEPVLRGSRSASEVYRHPVYGLPEDLLVVDLAEVRPELKGLRLRGRMEGRRVVPYWSRADIENGRAPLRGRELLWLDDPLDAFFLQVQGSGQVRLDSGEVLRLGYADQNGHPYTSVGRVLVQQGELTVEQASMQGIRAWAATHPERTAELLNQNASYVFFRELPPGSPGPVGSLGIPLAPGRSIAVDPRVIPPGAPVFVSTRVPGTGAALQRLMAAQDTGGAIKGAVRADLFWGSGDAAGALAGVMREPGRLWVLLPRGQPPEAFLTRQ
jgi:membrane-bound lytic murein transglycosylase A